MPVPTFTEGASLVKVLRGPERASTCVVDVRDEDFRGGHIAGCVNIWSDQFHDDDSVDALIHKHSLAGYKQLVVTCFMSQQRGPFCASRLASRLDVEETAQQPQVLILYGGMRKFLREYGDQTDIVAGRG